jgi:hypothetical protein
LLTPIGAARHKAAAAAEEEEEENSSALRAGHGDRDCIASNRNITLLTNNDIKHLSAHLKCCVVTKNSPLEFKL